MAKNVQKIKETVKNYLFKLGFIVVDENEQGYEIWRQKDDNPKMDILIDFVEHKDNL